MFSSEAWLANPSSGFYNGVATQSLRLNTPDDPRLTRTPSSGGNRKTWTFSIWIKRGVITVNQVLFGAFSSGSESNFSYLSLHVDDQIGFDAYGTSYFHTNRLLRDTNAWYNLVFAVDTTQSTSGDRVKLYVNGVQDSSFASGSMPSLNLDTAFNDTCQHTLFANHYSGSYDSEVSGYVSDINFVDGSQLTATSFGEFKNGVWIPKDTSGLTFGTNGFRLQFKNTSVGSGSASTIGADTSGNTNHYTSTNVVASDCALPDCPENNFCTWNGLFRGGEQSSSITASSTLSEGNLEVSVPTNSYMGNTFRPTSGKWYCEIYLKTRGSVNGEIDYGWLQATTYSSATAHGGVANKWGAYYHGYAAARYVLYDEASQLGSDITYEIAQGDVLQLAWDIDNAKGWIGVNNTWYRTDASDGNPSAGSNEAFSWTADEAQNLQVYVANGTSTDVHVANFGQDSTFAGSISASGNTDANGYPFKYTPPTGFLALCSANLPEVSIGANSDTQATDHFDTFLFSGDGNNPRTLAHGLDFTPDWIWQKNRSSTWYHRLVDSSRGYAKDLFSNATSGEEASNSGGDITAVDATNMTLQGSSHNNDINGSGENFVMWNWKANGGTTSSNTDGSITSTVQANTDAGFSIVTHTGTGSVGTIGHSLGKKPAFIITKGLSSGYGWFVYNHISGATKATILNSSGAEDSYSTTYNNTEPTLSVFTVGTATATNGSGINYINYIFAEVEGYSKFGSYNGNSSADGTFIYTGFSPSWVMVKKASAAENWVIWDKERDTFNVRDSYLLANTTAAETVYGGVKVDFLSNGFKFRGNEQLINDSSNSFIYMAFAEQPFKYSNAK